MNTLLLFACTCLLALSVVAAHNSTVTKDYSFTYLYSTTLGASNQPINLLVDTTEYDSFLFSNSDRVYAAKILNESDLDLFKDNISINGMLLQNFTFSVKEDHTNLNNSALQGVLGLGVSSRTRKNEVVASLQKQKLLNKGVVTMTMQPQSKIEFVSADDALSLNDYQHGCSLLNASSLSDTKHRDSWVCEYSHVLVSRTNTNSNLTWNSSVPIHARALFDSTTMHIIAPLEYIELMFELSGMTHEECSIVNVVNVDAGNNSSNSESQVNCVFKEGSNRLSQLNDLYFVFEGFAYPIRAEDLFFKVNDNEFTFKVKFRQEANNIWVFGYPFFASYSIAFDFDNHVIRFNGSSIANFTSDYAEWKAENDRFFARTYNDKPKIVISGIIGCVIILTVLIMIIRAFVRKNNPHIHSELVEEVNK